MNEKELDKLARAWSKWCAIKVRIDGNIRTWEERFVVNQEFAGSPKEAGQAFMDKLVKRGYGHRGIVEVRVNESGSLQGHYFFVKNGVLK